MRIKSLAATAVTTLGLLLTGVSSAQAWHQPYGGCEEASLLPHGTAAQECRAHGWTIMTRLVVNPHGVVKGSGLPHCRNEDGAGQRMACSWNFPDFTEPVTVDGNGDGLSYWIGRKDRTHFGTIHYVWPVKPLSGAWRWVSPELGDALAEGEHQEANWEHCMTRPRHGLAQVACPDGFGSSAP